MHIARWTRDRRVGHIQIFPIGKEGGYTRDLGRFGGTLMEDSVND